jgi:two-component system nitrogen regulation response regulator GlnG
MTQQQTVLVADDDASIRTVLNQALSRANYDVRMTASANGLWKWVEAGEGDIVITDVVMPDENIFEILPRIKKIRPDLPVIVMSAQNTFMTAIRATEKGAYDYLPKPFDLKDLLNIIKKALAEPYKAGLAYDAPEHDDMLPLVGRSQAMQDIYRMLARLMKTDLTVMITGESGTGKELVAKALHDFGERKKGPFVAVNMAAIPRDLIEAELFGYEKGAFTGAHNRTTGRFEQAQGGTLFLDEIGDMPMDAQTRLLRVLQQGEYMRVGGHHAIQTDVRIIAASNKDLQKLIARGLFREDLYYRLNVVPLRIPPLRERREDIPDLVKYFFKRSEETGLGQKYLEQPAYDILQSYRWPGNVRELENLILRLSALYPEECITAEVLQNELAQVNQLSIDSQDVDAPVSLADAVNIALKPYVKNGRLDMTSQDIYHKLLADFEKPLLTFILNLTQGNQIKAADVLGLNRNTLRKKVRDLDIPIIKNHRKPL